jgi:type II secretory ATPase GspE/PulE/Tfp pilus assembly ATPase PilB-like protein
MIGEMRDRETAKTAIEASLTGHLVLSTLHTNSAPETVVRLIEMGMDPINFSQALLCVLTQRLTRRLCEHCKKPYHPDHQEYEALVKAYDPKWFHKHRMKAYSDDFTLMKKGRCEKCNGIGYKGRVGLFEVLVNMVNIRKGITENLTAEDLKQLALEDGMKTLRMDGLQKVFKGLTDVDQVLRVCM